MNNVIAEFCFAGSRLCMVDPLMSYFSLNAISCVCSCCGFVLFSLGSSLYDGPMYDIYLPAIDITAGFDYANPVSVAAPSDLDVPEAETDTAGVLVNQVPNQTQEHADNVARSRFLRNYGIFREKMSERNLDLSCLSHAKTTRLGNANTVPSFFRRADIDQLRSFYYGTGWLLVGLSCFLLALQFSFGN